jgi:hypothetical protein
MTFIKGAAILLLFLSLNSFAQNKRIANQQNREKLGPAAENNTVPALFLHLDKNIYTNNEKIWFSSYFLKPSDFPNNEGILTVAIINTLQKKVFASTKFLIQNGTCQGALNIPDSIPPGQYQVHAHTNQMESTGKPTFASNQLIQIKNIRHQTQKSKLLILDNSPHNIFRIKLAIENLQTDDKKNFEVNYTLGSDSKKLVKANKEKEYIINIPIKDVPSAAPILSTCIKYGDEYLYNSLKLPLKDSALVTAYFHPEGGIAYNGYNTNIGWETLDSSGQPISKKGILKEDDLILDTITTNSYGMGRFDVFFQKDKSYTVTLIDDASKIENAVFKLPERKNEGISLSLPVAVVKDTVRMILTSNKVRSVKVMVLDSQNKYVAVDLPLKKNNNRLAIAIPNLSKGFYTIIILDENGFKLAERLFFVKANSSASYAVVSTNKDNYRRRDSVNLRIKVVTQDSNIKGLVSVACVQQNRLSSLNSRNIENYYYLDRELMKLPGSPNGRDLEDSIYLEHITLLRMSMSNKQSSSLAPISWDKANVKFLPALQVRVLKNDKPVKEPVEINTFDLKVAEIFTTDSLGAYSFKAGELITSSGSKQRLSINQKNKNDFKILTFDPDTAIMNWVLKNDVHYVLSRSIATTYEEELNLNSMDAVKKLREVTVKGSRNNSIYGAKAFGSNECGDYVNQDGYLNWPGSANSRQNRPPIKGVRYIDGKRYTRPNGQIDEYRNMGANGDQKFTVAFIIYEGCTTDASKQYTDVDGVYLTDKFIKLSKEQLFDSEPQYLSTVFWESGISLNANREYEVSFPLGDIQGPFKIIVQGVNPEDVIYQEKLITVN